jgi:hypothetical protein
MPSPRDLTASEEVHHPLGGVPDIAELDIELNRPEIRHTPIGHRTAGRIVPCQTPMWAGESPMFNAHRLAGTLVRKLRDVASHVDPSTGIKRKRSYTWLADKTLTLSFSGCFLILKHKARLATLSILLL